MKTRKNTALVVGANGVIGNNLIDYLEKMEEWEIIGLSRRANADRVNVSFIAVDLLDIADCL